MTFQRGQAEKNAGKSGAIHKVMEQVRQIRRAPGRSGKWPGKGHRAARAMGYKKVVTYILDTETGNSLKAAGYKCEGKAGGVEWTGKRKPKNPEQYPRQMKTRWVKISKKQ